MNTAYDRSKLNRLPTWQAHWAKGLFWGWNIIFLAFMALGFAPRLIPELITSIRTGSITVQFLLYAVVLSLVPPVTMLFAYLFLRQDAYRLFALGYVVEGPLMLILAVRFFVIRQSSPALSVLIITAFLGMAAFLWELVDSHPEARAKLIVLLRLVGLTMMLMVAAYAALWIAFYAIPGVVLVIQVINEAVRNIANLFKDPLWLPFSLLGFILLLLTSSLFIFAPVAVPALTYISWRRSLQASNMQLRPSVSWITVIVVAVVTSAAFVLGNRQPQINAFALLEIPPDSPAAAARLMKQEQQIRKGLLNAYLAPFRYISSLGEVGHVRDLYTGIAGFSLDTSLQVERAYELVARPLLYQPVDYTPLQEPQTGARIFAMQRESIQAARLYQRVFDETIVEAERSQILLAARSTWDRNRAEDALQALEEKTVHLEEQEITVTEHNDWAEIELHEVYRNTTAQRQEIIYYFNLPETAVITGIWLGNSADRGSRFEYQVAPRGAAQAVYREQVRRNVDPALVEQIGPRQYRLRIFPIEPLEMTYDTQRDRWESGEAPPLHLWISWKTMANAQNWPLPRLALKRNIFWDKTTLRNYNQFDPPAAFDPNAEKSWLPQELSAQEAPVPSSHRFMLPGGVTVSAEPALPAAGDMPADNSNLALVIDRSRSMEQHAQQVEAAINELRSRSFQNVDVYLSSSKYRGEEPTRISFADLNPNHLVYMGGQNPSELLAQFEALRQGTEYDAVLVITDATGYELGPGSYTIPVPAVPVWFVHLGSQVPIGYDDPTLAAIQGSGGGVANSITEALQRIAAGLDSHSAGSAPAADIVDGYRWTIIANESNTTVEGSADEPGFASIAARRAILAQMQLSAVNLDDPATLDRLHQWAQDYGIVTPYSSMIVLVDNQQRRLLEQLSQLDDRYQREVESLGETTPSTQTPIVGVPEPEEWLLIAVALLLLAYAAYTRKLFRPERLFNSSGK